MSIDYHCELIALMKCQSLWSLGVHCTLAMFYLIRYYFRPAEVAKRKSLLYASYFVPRHLHYQEELSCWDNCRFIELEFLFHIKQILLHYIIYKANMEKQPIKVSYPERYNNPAK